MGNIESKSRKALDAELNRDKEFRKSRGKTKDHDPATFDEYTQAIDRGLALLNGKQKELLLGRSTNRYVKDQIKKIMSFIEDEHKKGKLDKNSLKEYETRYKAVHDSFGLASNLKFWGASPKFRNAARNFLDYANDNRRTDRENNRILEEEVEAEPSSLKKGNLVPQQHNKASSMSTSQTDSINHKKVNKVASENFKDINWINDESGKIKENQEFTSEHIEKLTSDTYEPLDDDNAFQISILDSFTSAAEAYKSFQSEETKKEIALFKDKLSQIIDYKFYKQNNMNRASVFEGYIKEINKAIQTLSSHDWENQEIDNNFKNGINCIKEFNAKNMENKTSYDNTLLDNINTAFDEITEILQDKMRDRRNKIYAAQGITPDIPYLNLDDPQQGPNSQGVSHSNLDQREGEVVKEDDPLIQSRSEKVVNKLIASADPAFIGIIDRVQKRFEEIKEMKEMKEIGCGSEVLKNMENRMLQKIRLKMLDIYLKRKDMCNRKLEFDFQISRESLRAYVDLKKTVSAG